jgi:dihydrofolate reductase
VSEHRERKLVYSMAVSLDGFIAGPGGEIDWAAPDRELHRFHNEQMREIGVHLCGRRLYETMLYWESAEDRPSEVGQEFAGIWQRLPKVVFSSSLERVLGNATLADDDLAGEIRRLKREPAGGDIAIGGATLAARAIELDLIDEYRPFVNPVVLGGGTPFLPGGVRVALELLETRTFGSRVAYLRYRRL